MARTGRASITASDDQTVRVWDAESGDEPPHRTGHMARVCLRPLARMGRIVTASADQTARPWDAQSGHELRQLGGRHREGLVGDL